MKLTFIALLLIVTRLLSVEALAARKPEAAPATPGAACACSTTPAAAGNSFSRDSLYQADLTFTDDAGRTIRLGDLCGRPVVIAMFFASCGYACPLIVSDMAEIQTKLAPALRRRVAFVLVSFDVERDVPAALAKYRADRQLDDQWMLLHGSDDAVRELAALLGVKFQREIDGSFSHSNLITILSEEGKIVHQRTGLKGGLDEVAAALAPGPRHP